MTERRIGVPIRQPEAEAVLTACLKRIDGFEFAGEPERRLDNTLRGFARLPVGVRRLN